MECTIQLAKDGILYTDIDNRDEVRAKKLALMGVNKPFSTYRYDDIEWIADKCDRVNLLRPTSLVSKYTFAFEEVLKRVKDKSKVAPQTYYFQSLWSIGQSMPDIEPDEKDLYTVYEKKDEELVPYEHWDLMFYSAWTELFNVENKVEHWDKIIADLERGLGRNLYHREYLGGTSEFRGHSGIARGGLGIEKFCSRLSQYRLIRMGIPTQYIDDLMWDLFTKSDFMLNIYSFHVTRMVWFTKADITSNDIKQYLKSKYKKDFVVEQQG